MSPKRIVWRLGVLGRGWSRGWLWLGLILELSLSAWVAQAQTQPQNPSPDEAVVLHGHEAPVLMGLLTPDGERAVTVSSDETARLWDLKTRQEIRRYPGHTGPLYCLALSQDGRSLVTGAQDNTLRLWDVPQPRPLLWVPGHKGRARGLALSQDGRLLVSGGDDKTVNLWNLPTLASVAQAGKLPESPPALARLGHDQDIVAASVRNDGNLIATGDAGGRILLWSPFVDGSQGEVGRHEGGVSGLAFHGNNQQLLSAGTDGQVRLWQLPPTPNQPMATPPIRVFAAHQKPVLDLALCNGGAQVITCSSDGRVVMSEVSNGQPIRAFEGHVGEPRAVASRSDNQRIAAGTSAGKVFLWNAGDSRLLQTLEVPGAVTALAFSPDNQKLAVATEQKQLILFGPPLPPLSSQPGHELVEHQRAMAEAALTRVIFDRDNRHVWGAHADGHVSQWAYASPVQLRQFNHGGPVYGVAISRDGKTIVSCSADQTVRIWDAATGGQRAALSGHQGAVHVVALTPDESLIVSAGADRTVRLWDVAGGRLLKQLATFEETPYSVAIHPDGKTVAVGGADRKVHLINLLTGAIERTLEGHTDYVHGVAFNPKGTRLLSYGYAGQLRVWNPADGKPLFEQRIGRIGNFAHYTADGTRVLLSNGDATARLFDLPATAQ